jgi:agmatine deiminase
MICNPGSVEIVREHCGDSVIPVEMPINDSWVRDSGPAFVRHTTMPDQFAVVGFRFNAWGNRWHPHDDDAALSERLAAWLGLPFFRSPLVLEGGAFFVDGQGTVVTTEQCLLNPNRNPQLRRDDISAALCEYLGATCVVWLPFGHSLDTGPNGTDGHIDGVLQYVAPGRVMIEVVDDPSSPEHARGLQNLAALERQRDARGRPFAIETLDPGPEAGVSYANHYLANGAVIVPIEGQASGSASTAEARSIDRLAAIYPDREIVPVPGCEIAAGGGGPHCITQQIPHGIVIPGV